MIKEPHEAHFGGALRIVNLITRAANDERA
jgi:hypothetical protein